MALGGGNMRKGAPSRSSPAKQTQGARTMRGTPTPASRGVGAPALASAAGVPATPAAAPSATPAIPAGVGGGGVGGAPMMPGAGGGAMPTMRKGGKVKKTAHAKGKRR